MEELDRECRSRLHLFAELTMLRTNSRCVYALVQAHRGQVLVSLVEQAARAKDEQTIEQDGAEGRVKQRRRRCESASRPQGR